nr:universal stress protein [Luteibacter sp. UNCMF331Sha3.1]
MIPGPGAHDGDAASLRRYFASLLFETGLPVLVIPHGAEPVVPPRRAVVAWADTRECVRAIHDALPLLKGCEWVSVASVNDSHASEPAEVVALLKHHGVKAEPSLLKLSGDESTASRILEHAATSHAHIIVAGGYGHSRLREWAIGGVTRELLMHARIPVLFSH